jgi:hypothetical protein
MRRIEVLNEHDGEARRAAEETEELRDRGEPPRGRADGNDRERRARHLSRGVRRLGWRLRLLLRVSIEAGSDRGGHNEWQTYALLGRRAGWALFSSESSESDEDDLAPQILAASFIGSGDFWRRVVERSFP